MDPLVAAAIVAVGSLVFFSLTNLHVFRGIKHVRDDIESKRAATERFVSTQISRIERSVADVAAKVEDLVKSPLPPDLVDRLDLMTARVDAIVVPQLPPGLEGLDARFDELRAELDEFVVQVRDDLGRANLAIEGLPAKLRMAQLSLEGVDQRAAQLMIREQGADLEQAVDLKEAILAGDPEMVRAAAMAKLAKFTLSEEEQKKHPFLALAVEFGKPAVLQFIHEGGIVGRTTPSARPALPSRRSSSDL